MVSALGNWGVLELLPNRAQRLTASMVSARRGATSIVAITRCSTPYGINGFGTFSEALWSLGRCCAQRLTASMVSAQVDQQQAMKSADRCSTPYGINGFGTSSLSDHRGVYLGAQRLTASMVSAPCIKKPWISCFCRAQRLTASMVSAQSVGNA